MTITKLKLKPKEETIRYFESDFLEKFCYPRLWHNLAIWLPISILSTIAALYFGGLAQVNFWLLLLEVIVAFAIGALRWTLMEYLIHRDSFHYTGNNPLFKNIAWVHEVHHKQPMVASTSLTPSAISLPVGILLAFGDWLLWHAILGQVWIAFALVSGTALAFMCYDLIHWSLHSLDSDNQVFKKLRSHHMRHHSTDTLRYGVSSPMWDHVFGTYPTKESNKTANDVTDTDSVTEPEEVSSEETNLLKDEDLQI